MDKNTIVEMLDKIIESLERKLSNSDEELSEYINNIILPVVGTMRDAVNYDKE